MERCRGKTGDDITLDPDGDIVLYADAQATIAALQKERDEYKTMYACLKGGGGAHD